MNAQQFGGDRLTATAAKAASLSVSTKSSTLYAVWGYNDNAAARYIQIFDSATLPADTAVPSVHSIYVAAGANFSFSIPGGIPCNSGIQICNSSSDVTKTVGAADSLIFAAYKED